MIALDSRTFDWKEDLGRWSAVAISQPNSAPSVRFVWHEKIGWIEHFPADSLKHIYTAEFNDELLALAQGSSLLLEDE